MQLRRRHARLTQRVTEFLLPARRVHAREAGQGRGFRAVEAEELCDGQHRGAHLPRWRAGEKEVAGGSIRDCSVRSHW